MVHCTSIKAGLVMRNPRVEHWEEKLDTLLRRVDEKLEVEYGDHRDLHSFPTRRSSDLMQRIGGRHKKLQFLTSNEPA